MSDVVRKIIASSGEGAARQWDADFFAAMNATWVPAVFQANGRQLCLNLDGTITGDPMDFLREAMRLTPTPQQGILVAFGRLAVRLAALERSAAG